MCNGHTHNGHSAQAESDRRSHDDCSCRTVPASVSYLFRVGVLSAAAGNCFVTCVRGDDSLSRVVTGGHGLESRDGVLAELSSANEGLNGSGALPFWRVVLDEAPSKQLPERAPTPRSISFEPFVVDGELAAIAQPPFDEGSEKRASNGSKFIPTPSLPTEHGPAAAHARTPTRTPSLRAQVAARQLAARQESPATRGGEPQAVLSAHAEWARAVEFDAYHDPEENTADHDHDHDHDSTDHDHDHVHDHDHDHEHEHESGLNWPRIGSVIGAALVLASVACFGVFLALRYSGVNRVFTRVSQAFGAGAFWSLGITHLMLESTDLCRELKYGIHFKSGSLMLATYPLALAGFLGIFLVQCGIGYAMQVLRQHEHVSIQNVQRYISMLLAVSGLCIHSFVEGMVAGMRDTVSVIWIATIAICLHKWVEGLAVSVALLPLTSRRSFFIIIAILISASPIGAIVGLFTGAYENKLSATLNSLAVGVVLFCAAELTADLMKTNVNDDDTTAVCCGGAKSTPPATHAHAHVEEVPVSDVHLEIAAAPGAAECCCAPDGGLESGSSSGSQSSCCAAAGKVSHPTGPRRYSPVWGLVEGLFVVLGGGLVLGATAWHLASPSGHVHGAE